MGITGRPKSQNPKNIMASVRITEAERDLLMLGYGTVNGGLRFALDRLLAEPVRTEPTASAEGGVMADVIAAHGAGGGFPVDHANQPHIEGTNLAENPSTKRHIHKPVSLVRDFADQGTQMQEWACSCGHLMTRRAA